MWFFGCFIELRGLISKNFTTQKSLRIIFFGILYPKNCKKFNFWSFDHWPKMWLSSKKLQKIRFLQFWGCRIPKNIILRLFCVVKFFDISPLSSIKHPKNHILQNTNQFFAPELHFGGGVYCSHWNQNSNFWI